MKGKKFLALNSSSSRAGSVISRFIGGVYVDRANIGQEGGNKPYTPVSLSDQKRAMNAIKKYVFSPSAYNAPTNVYNLLAKQRRGFDFFSGPEDPKIHDQVLSYQTRVLAHILHPNTLQRIIDSELYGNKLPKGQELKEFLTKKFGKPQIFISMMSKTEIPIWRLPDWQKAWKTINVHKDDVDSDFGTSPS